MPGRRHASFHEDRSERICVQRLTYQMWAGLRLASCRKSCAYLAELRSGPYGDGFVGCYARTLAADKIFRIFRSSSFGPFEMQTSRQVPFEDKSSIYRQAVTDNDTRRGFWSRTWFLRRPAVAWKLLRKTVSEALEHNIQRMSAALFSLRF